MLEFDPQEFSEEVESRVWEKLPGAMGRLVGGSERVDVKATEALIGGVAGGYGGDRRSCLEAGLWLLAGDLDRCHRLCQEVGTAHGSAWHAAMHRQEGDFWNSKYWWRRAGGIRWEAGKGVLEKIAGGAPGRIRRELEALLKRYDPAAFVDLVEERRGDAEAVEALLDVQRWEWAALFVETMRG